MTDHRTSYEIRQCTDPVCDFRFPAAQEQLPGNRCPWCGGATIVVHQLSLAPERAAQGSSLPVQVSAPFAALLDNVRSTFNVGSIFRSSDGAGVDHLYLCGVTPTPKHSKLARAALGADQSVAWSHHRNAVTLAQRLRRDGYTLWALETGRDSISIFETEAPSPPFVLVVGSEVTGIDPDLLALCAHHVSIPMAGCKQSLNVATAFGIAAILLRRHLSRIAAIKATKG